MAHKTGKDLRLKIDNASAALTDISGSVNSQSIQFAITILDDTGMGDTKHSTLQGLAQPTRIPLNGWVDSTTDAIFGPIADGTSTTKTIEFRAYASRFYNGEFNMENFQISGTPDDLETWSADFVGVGTVNRTSKAL
jgi:hypothetical protein